MTLNDFITDYPNEFQECVSDIDWRLVFAQIDNGTFDDLANYLSDHFDAYQEGLMPQDGPDPDELYDMQRQKKIDNDVSFEDAAHITNMTRDKWDK